MLLSSILLCRTCTSHFACFGDDGRVWWDILVAVVAFGEGILEYQKTKQEGKQKKKENKNNKTK